MMNKPSVIDSSLADAIERLYGEGRRIESRSCVSGGDINDAFRLMLDDGTILFMKSNTACALSNFEAEAAGLDAIKKTGAIGVPAVLALGTDGGRSFLLLEYISGAARVPGYWETFARELAGMHRAEMGTKFGFETDNFIGSRKQINTPHDSWIGFFRDCRLAPQLKAAEHYFSAKDRRRAEHLLSHLDNYLTEPEKPALVHGDLWSGNMITGNDGKGWLIDPAVYYGHPEADIAMTELFGGFSSQFYDAYREAGLMEDGYADRKDLYNLYQLLNHLNMFGGGYLSSVLRIIGRYAGE